MPRLKMWGHRGSSCCQTVLWAADELGIPVDLTDTGGGHGGLGAPEYLALNPNKVVPTIDDNGFVLWESAAILMYLASTYGNGSLFPTNPRARGEAFRWIAWQGTTLRPKLLPLNHGWIVVENPKYRHLEELEEIRRGTERTWMILERHLAGRDFVSGGDFSMGDIPVGIMAYWWYRMPIEHFDLPNVRAWYGRLADRPSFQRQVLR